MKHTTLFLFFLFTAFTSFAQVAPDPTDTRPKCEATTKAGTPCKHHAVSPSTFCNVHNPDTPRCGAATKSGAPCKRTVKTPGQHCAVHTSKP